MKQKMIIDCIADLHGFMPDLKGGDLLIVGGDLTARDEPIQYGKFAAWMDRQKYTKKILIAGNHDTYFQKEGFESIKDVYDDIGVDYLCDSGTEFRYWPPLKPGMEDGTTLQIKDYKIWGIPWTKRFIGMNPHCMAFTYYDENWFYDEKVAKIPVDVDILITHSPPYGILDETFDGIKAGSKSLMKGIEKVLPEVVIFGHIHEQGGKVCKIKGIKFVNASIMDENYDPVNKAIRIIL
jgi:Icc-related predicted phosphoesterase